MNQDPTFPPARAAREILATAPAASLGTLNADGTPFVSLAAIGQMPDGRPTLWISRLAVHTRNLERDPRASLLAVAPGGETADPLAGGRLTLTGRVKHSADNAIGKRRFIARNPAAAGYADFPDFGFRLFEAEASHLVAGFGRIQSVPIADLFPDFSASDVVGAEEDIISHMNADHARTSRLYATKLLGQPDGAWRVTGSDPDGLDLACENRRCRLWYPERAQNAEHVRHSLKMLAEEARRR
jgi:putative heme iron utilization protein